MQAVAGFFAQSISAADAILSKGFIALRVFMVMPLHLVGYAYGQAAGDPGCADGPDVFKKSSWFKKLTNEQKNIIWDTTFYPQSFLDKYADTRVMCQRLALKIQELTKVGNRFITIGGDHSSAIGTWSGVYHAAYSQGPLGLIWIDAHMDSHTTQTSPSGNIHGMPLAVLLGYGEPALAQLMQPVAKLSPEHVCLIGIRSFESGEAKLLERLKVRIFYMEEVKQRGLAAVFAEALSIVRQNTAGFGVSIDLDGLDPSEAPGVGTPEASGLSASKLCLALSEIRDDQKFLGAEIVEFNPHHDKSHKTEEVIYQLICAMNMR